WQYDSTSHVLVDVSTGSNVVATIIGRVLEHCLRCRPSGNYINPRFGTLATAKFQLQLGKPFGTLFANDYNSVLKNVKKIQAQVASMQDQ
ncbi:hypothetical protein EI94DRAFT_1599115, partial [Lactarius quietus]